ncbi:MFS transporter [Pelagibius litoralis]|uniref:MFS transporter n=1 Tax=Pelagibius litoralis TaxID=374515 RepID=A0A967KBJ6_9PROT|nr:MFS transporter [Pelagibius litoralis]NIA71127.1 MFS transporter [Pelagibius litoralis]
MKFRSITLLLIAELAAMSLWFVSAAILPDMLREAELSSARQAALSSGVQAGFVIGALASAIFGIPDRYDPRRVFAACALAAGAANAVLLFVPPGSSAAIVARVATGALLAGVYPVGMKIVVGWGKDDRGFLVGILVAALTLGSASPYLIALSGGADWRITVAAASLASLFAGILCLGVGLGSHHGRAQRFDPKVIVAAWTNRRVRLAYIGYLGHMWELYAMWAWIAAATAISYSVTLPSAEAEQLSKLTAFVAIGAGSLTCVVAGIAADRIGKARIAIIAMAVSGASAVAAGVTFGGPVWLTFVIVVIWGISIIPDSAQFSALVADASPPEQAGSLMTFQTALGFALTFVTVQVTPVLAANFGWPLVLIALAAGPAVGILAMARLQAMR